MDKNEKKRKRSEDAHAEPTAKRVAAESSAKTINVSIASNDLEWGPILVTTPGLSVPYTARLKPYRKLRQPQDANDSSAEVLLYSAASPRLDYVAREEELNSTDALMRHYIGIYDRDTAALNLVPSRKATIRGTPRPEKADGTLEGDNIPSSQNLSSRTNLSLAFGTRKAQKAIRRAITDNAITSAVPNPSGSSLTENVLEPAAAAILDVIDASAPSLHAQEEMKQTAEEARPGPKPHLKAETPAEVYPLEELVGLDLLRILAVRDWQEKVAAGEDIVTKSRYVSGRVREVVKSGNVREIKALKYLLLLVEWYHCLKSTKQRGAKELPPTAVLAKAIDGTSEELREIIRVRFAEGKQVNKWHTDNLHLHICAIALAIDNFATDFYDLSQDLRLESPKIQKFFTLLGCVVSSPSAAELARLQLSKKEAVGHKVARLRVPLKLPQTKIKLRRARKKFS